MPGSPDAQGGAALETAIIFTERMEALAAFYQEALQLGPFERSPKHMGQQVGAVYLGFDQIDSLEGNARTGVTLWFTLNDIQATFDRLVALGAKVRYPPTQKPWGGFLACVYDLDGNMLGLSQRDSRTSR
jgi:predicted enzyme related to lactoylglutathione lyase